MLQHNHINWHLLDSQITMKKDPSRIWKLEGQLFERNYILDRHIIILNIVFRFILNYSFGDCEGGEVISVGFILCFIIQIVGLFSKFTSFLILVYFKINYVSFQLTYCHCIFTLTVTKPSVTQYCPSSRGPTSRL